MVNNFHHIIHTSSMATQIGESSKQDRAPTAEALTLAAAAFHAEVDAWIPAGFGVMRSQAEKDAEWAAACAYGARGADGEEARRSRAGGEVLRRALKRKGGDAPLPERREEADDGESRAAAVSSKKRKTKDAFGKAGAVHPLLNLKNPIPGYDAPAEPRVVRAAPAKKAQVDDSVNAAAALAASLSTGGATMRVVSRPPPSPKSPKAKIGSTPGSPTAKKTPSVAASETGTSEGAEPKSKSALRREKRKAAKARKAAL